MRRLVGLVSMLLMFHLTLVGSDFVCAKHNGASSGGFHSQSGNGHQHHLTQSHSEQADACDTPIAPDCCSALASCSTVVLASMPEFGAGAPLAVGLPVESTSLALLRNVAPETPPPRG